MATKDPIQSENQYYKKTTPIGDAYSWLVSLLLEREILYHETHPTPKAVIVIPEQHKLYTPVHRKPVKLGFGLFNEKKNSVQNPSQY